jgi:hypothetical protein
MLHDERKNNSLHTLDLWSGAYLTGLTIPMDLRQRVTFGVNIRRRKRNRRIPYLAVSRISVFFEDSIAKLGPFVNKELICGKSQKIATQN